MPVPPSVLLWSHELWKSEWWITYLVSHPLLGLCTEHALLSFGIPRRNQLLSKMVANVLHDCLALGNDNIFLRVGRSDRNSWRFSQGVDGLEVGACTPVGIAHVNFDVVVEIELLQKPDDALAARLVEPVVALDLRLRHPVRKELRCGVSTHQ